MHRLAHGKLGTVFAYKSEFDAWWLESQSKVEIEDDKPEEDLDGFELDVTELVPTAGRVGKQGNGPLPSSSPHNHPQCAGSSRAWQYRSSSIGFGLRQRRTPTTHKMILAVRPFKNLSGDPGQDFIADGMTEEMISHLGQLHPDEMGVILLSPAYVAQGLDRIGREVRANYLLEGGVRRSGQKIAITAHLIQAQRPDPGLGRKLRA